MNRIEFYQMIGTGIRRYLPMGYQDYQVHIKEARDQREEKCPAGVGKRGR
ncbi:MAG: hypothetical protein ACLU6Y_13130 [Ruminococcus sp.]